MENEKRLIEANALLEKMQFRLPINDKTSEVIAECMEIVVRYIKNAPTVDAVEVVHGKWSYDYTDAVCSNCGFKWFDGCQECGVCPSDVNYCPNCGAKMDGGNEDG